VPEVSLLWQLQQEMQVQALQEFYTTLRDKCWDKCITKPSSSLSSSEQQCLARCCDRYAEATKIVLQSIVSSAQGGQANF